MFCSKCGGNVTDGSQFCSKCGNNVGISVGGGAAAAPARIQAQPKKGGIRLWHVVVLFVLLITALSLYVMVSTHQEVPQTRPTQAVQPQLKRHTLSFGSGALTVAQARSSYFKMVVPADATEVHLQGHFTAQGGSGNDIIVQVMNENEFVNWQNHHGQDTLWDSDKVTVGDIKLSLPNGAGTYYLLFNNSFSLITPKAVQHNITLTYLSRE
ncbi:MAG TPA: zinc ribbon domain-containing protein [Terriglobales bacterium]|nr:zinc ribbon domain-containing protein [Terriglobales bacterium]